MFRSKNMVYEGFTEYAMFQSLFSWMFRSKVSSVFVQTAFSSVSILVLVDVSLEKDAIAKLFVDALFQSLFSWMFRSKPA